MQSSPIDDDARPTPADVRVDTARALASMISTLEAQHDAPFLQPCRFDDAGWVANRWREILPISQQAKQKLMELADPLVRLDLVDDYPRNNRVVG